MTTRPATQLAAVAAFLADFPELEPISVRYSQHPDGDTEIHAYSPDIAAWCDALEVLPPAESDWTLWAARYDDLVFTIPATPDRPFSVFALASPEYVRGLREAGVVA